MRKKYFKSILAVIVIITLMKTNLIKVLADDLQLPTNVILEGNAEGIVFIDGNDVFLEDPHMLPGDTVSRTLILDNKYTSEYEIYLRAEKVNPKEEFDLLEKLELVVEYEDKTMYKGPATGENEEEDSQYSMVENIYLGKLNPGEKKTLNAKALLPGETIGNEYKNKKAEVNWIFTAICKENPEDPDEDSELPQTGQPFGVTSQILVASVAILGGLKLKKIK